MRMTAEHVDEYIAEVVGSTIDQGQQPLRVLVSVASYRLLLARDGLEPRHIGATARGSLRARVCGLDLPVDCDKWAGDDYAYATSMLMPKGLA